MLQRSVTLMRRLLWRRPSESTSGIGLRDITELTTNRPCVTAYHIRLDAYATTGLKEDTILKEDSIPTQEDSVPAAGVVSPGWTHSLVPSAQFSCFQIGTDSVRRSINH